jgi:hypothetical protein
VLFVLYTGIQWEYLPQELGFGSGPTCWRRLAEWQEAGVWEELQRVLLDRLRAADRLDFSRVTVDASHVQAKRGRSSPKVGPSPVDRARPGSKHHFLTDAHGTPRRPCAEWSPASLMAHQVSQDPVSMSRRAFPGGLPDQAPVRRKSPGGKPSRPSGAMFLTILDRRVPVYSRDCP